MPSAYLDLVLNSTKVDRDSSILPASVRLLEVYKYRGLGLYGLFGRLGRVSFCFGRHKGGSRPHSRGSLGWPNPDSQQSASDCFCIYLPSKCMFERISSLTHV